MISKLMQANVGTVEEIRSMIDRLVFTGRATRSEHMSEADLMRAKRAEVRRRVRAKKRMENQAL